MRSKHDFGTIEQWSRDEIYRLVTTEFLLCAENIFKILSKHKYESNKTKERDYVYWASLFTVVIINYFQQKRITILKTANTSLSQLLTSKKSNVALNLVITVRGNRCVDIHGCNNLFFTIYKKFTTYNKKIRREKTNCWNNKIFSSRSGRSFSFGKYLFDRFNFVTNTFVNITDNSGITRATYRSVPTPLGATRGAQGGLRRSQAQNQHPQISDSLLSVITLCLRSSESRANL